MGAVVIKLDKKNNRLISKLVKELGGKVIVIDDEQYEDFALGKIMDQEKTGDNADRNAVMKKIRNEG